MTIMASHSSATTREETSHVTSTTRTATIINALRLRAQEVLNDETIDSQSRAVIRHGLETNDPWLAKLLSCADAGETVGTKHFSQTSEIAEPDPSKEKIEALAELICGAGDESAAALLVLMGTLQNSADPKVLANTAKHCAFTRCGELYVYGIVETQIAKLASELLAGDTNLH
jgi:hypothetical protein